MLREAEIVKQARETAQLSVQQMASLVSLDEGELCGIEGGARRPSFEVLERFARVFGLSLPRFLGGAAATAPATILFRSLSSTGPSLEDLVESGSADTLGEFLRCASDAAELRALLGDDTHAATRVPALCEPPVAALPTQAESLAIAVRKQLGLDLAPIDSMVSLLRDQLGVMLFWVHPDELDRDIDAASVRLPQPAVLINLVGGAELWWRTRMSLAHELCHLVADLAPGAASGARAYLYSPHRHTEPKRGRPRMALPSDIEILERRANMFAAHFLAPGDAIRELVGDRSPMSDETVARVCSRFQIGQTTAINQLKHVFGLSKDERAAMLERSRGQLLPPSHPDGVAQPGLRQGVLCDLVSRALGCGLISKTRAREYLALSNSAPLPARSFTEDDARPLLDAEHLALVRAQRHLIQHHPTRQLYPATVHRQGERFVVKIAQAATEGEPREVGHLVVSPSGEVVEDTALPTSS